jgi:hypothetical protein
VDPDTDPDPAFQVNPNPDPDPIQIQGFYDQRLKKIQQKFVKYFFRIKNSNLLMSNLQEKPSALKREHPALQKKKFINFYLYL